MHRSMLASSSSLVSLLLLALALLAAPAPAAWSAEPEAPPARPAAPPTTRPAPGLAGLRPGGRLSVPSRPTARVVKVADGSIVIRPTTAPAVDSAGKAADAKPPAAPAAGAAAATAPAADQTFAVDKERTRVVIETVVSERLTNTGQRSRMSRYDPGEVADLEAGQFVHVIAEDAGVATQIAIMTDPDAPIPAPATIVKVDEKSITVQPAPPPAPRRRPAAVNADAPAAAPATTAPAAEHTYATDPQTTRVTVNELAGERALPNGQVVRSVRVRRGSLADLKVGQLVEVRLRGDTAAHIRIVPAPMRNADGTAR